MLGTFRFILAAMVLVSHTRGYPFGSLPDPGLIAIVAFFFLSGYLMPATLERNYGGATFGERSVRYLANRFLRIFPTYWVALVLMIAVLLTTDFHRDLYYLNSIKSFLQNALLLGLNQSETWNADQRFIGPAWTLDVELQYYILVPMIVLSARARPVLTFVTLVLLSLAGLWFQIKPTGLDSIDRCLLPWLAFFVAGALTYFFKDALRKLGSASWALAGLLFAILGLASASFSINAAQWLMAVSLMTVAARLLVWERPSSALDRYLGDLSYPIFLLHSVVIATGVPATITSSFLPGSIAGLAAVTFALTLPLAAIAEAAVDRAVSGLRNRLRSKQATLVPADARPVITT